MRIVHVIDSLGIGGAEWLLVNYLNYYKQVEPSSSHILVILETNMDLLPQVKGLLDHFEVIPFNKKNNLIGIRSFKKIMHTWKPDLVHSHLFYSTLLARLGSSGKIPVISTYHNQSYCKASPYYSPWFSLLDRFTFRKSCFRIFVSKAVQQCVEGATHSTRNGRLISNFVNTGFYPSWSFNATPNKLRLVAVGSLKKVKNHSILVDALALLPAIDVSIDIFGEGNLQQDLQGRINELKVAINLKGNQVLSSEVLKNYDGFIMPSLSEGQPVSLLEAMTTGLPSLLSNISSLTEIAGDAALYFSPNSSQELAMQITKVLNNKNLLITMSAIALERAAQYSIHNYFKEITKLYEVALRTAVDPQKI